MTKITKYPNTKKASVGMGSLIVFIAMILTAAIVGAVVISTSSTLQNNAKSTQQTASQEVGSSMFMVEMYASDGIDGELDYFYTTAKLIGGSDSVRFSDLLMYMALQNASQNYEYNSSINCSNKTTLDGNPDKFGVEYKIQGRLYKPGLISQGDVIKFCVKSPRSVGESEDMKVVIVPVYGKTWKLDIRTPEYIWDKIIYLFP